MGFFSPDCHNLGLTGEPLAATMAPFRRYSLCKRLRQLASLTDTPQEGPMWTFITVVTVVAIIVLFALLSLAGLVDPNPGNSQPPSNRRV